MRANSGDGIATKSALAKEAASVRTPTRVPSFSTQPNQVT